MYLAFLLGACVGYWLCALMTSCARADSTWRDRMDYQQGGRNA